MCTTARLLTRMMAALVVLGTALVLPAAPAHAHGEETQQAFVRSSTVLLYDVAFTRTELDVGDELTISGTVRIMDAWPDHTVAEPHTGFLSVIAPGPVVSVQSRTLNGVPTPQSVRIERGQTYDFEIVLRGREEGVWHVHPSFAVEGVGTLVGRGEWLDIGPGDYVQTAETAGGDELDLTSVGLDRVVTWHLAGAAVGVGWLVYWLRRPVLARLTAVDAGRGRGLTSRSDVVAGVLFAAAALGLLGVGNAVTAATLPDDLVPLQVSRSTVPPAPEPQRLVSSTVTRADLDRAADELRFSVDVRNQTSRPVRLDRMQVAELDLAGAMTVGPTSTVPAGARHSLTVTVDAGWLADHELLPLDEPQVRLTGLVFFTDGRGHQQVSEVDEVTAPVLPS